jgi:hypothetical protein
MTEQTRTVDVETIQHLPDAIRIRVERWRRVRSTRGAVTDEVRCKGEIAAAGEFWHDRLPHRTRAWTLVDQNQRLAATLTCYPIVELLSVWRVDVAAFHRATPSARR